jgi:centromeric protein E
MFKLKYPASASSPSLSTTTASAPSSPCRPSRSSSCALSVLQEQRQQHRHNPVPAFHSRTRSTSLLPLTPRRVPPPLISSPSSKAIDTTLDDPVRSVMNTPTKMASSSSHPELMAADEDFERGASPSSQNVIVCVRVRPASDEVKEDMWTMDEAKSRITPSNHHPNTKRNAISSPSKSSSPSKLAPLHDFSERDDYEFHFDSLVVPSKSTSDMYDANISPIVDAVISGYNGTVFAYGQTGSGKTHTMSGTTTEKGVIPRAVEEIFERVAKESNREFLLRVSYLEIYNEMLKDLLASYPSSSSSTDLSARPASPIKGGSSHVAGASSSETSSLRILEAGGRIQIQGLREEIVTNAEEVLDLLERGQRGRHQAATDWNERSSRSHCVFILTLESREQHTERGNDVRFSQLNLIDLAGSERAASEKERRKEGAFINKSLLTLGTVIAKLSDQCQTGKEDMHIPYRDSKLTRLLQTSLGGNARVAVVCTMSPLKEHAVESMSTLRFGQRCKTVVTKAKKGTIVSDKALIARYKKELERLRSQLDQGNNTVDMSMSHDDASFKELQSRREEAEKDVKTMNEKRDELKKQVEHLTKLILTGKDVAASGIEDRTDSFSSGRPRRAARRTDMGTSSLSKRQKLFDDQRSFLAPLNDDQENAFNISTPTIKPFALESELAQLRKNLSAAMMGRQASEEARVQEMQLWKARIMELEAANTEQEEELDEAEVAFEKLKKDRDTLRAKVAEEVEANRLLQLVAKSRGADMDQAQKLLLEQSHKDVERLREELKAENEMQMQLVATHEGQVNVLRQELACLQRALSEEQGKDGSIKALEGEIAALKDSQGHSSSVLLEMAKLREDLANALAEKEHFQKELTNITLERGQEDAERDFADLIKANDATSASEKTLAEKELQERTKEVEALQRELFELKQKTKPLPVPSVPASPSMSDSLRSVMERRLKISEDRCKALEEENSRIKLGSKNKGDQASQIANLEKQLLEAKQLMTPGSPLKGRTSLQRGGSMRNLKSYSLNAEGLPRNSNSEKEEIERLNAVIQSQRSMMSDLEGSVKAWKSRLRLQNDIITRLVEAGGVSIPNDELSPALSSSSSASSTSSSSLKRASSSASTISSPYYGAHTFNRAPTGLGLGSTSPTKGVKWISTMPGVSPDPLPLNDLTASPTTPRARRRPTIEHEIKELQGSPRVKSTTDRLLEAKSRPINAAATGTPAKLRRSRNYYV